MRCIPAICYLRLDFESFTILGPGFTGEFNSVVTQTGGFCRDTFTVTVRKSSPNGLEIDYTLASIAD